jgi:hypothetical protein
VWFDRWELVPGDPWQEKLEEALRQLNTSVVFIGRKGLGNWQAPEVRAALNRNAERKMRVVPVALPGVDVRDERIPLFLKNLDFCLLRSLDDQPNFERLVAGITGVHPRFARAAQAAARPVGDDARADRTRTARRSPTCRATSRTTPSPSSSAAD